MKKYIKVLLLAILAFLILGSPSESRFQMRLKKDFGSFHHGDLQLSVDDLNSIGQSNFQSYVLFSKYDYAFGNIGVSYIGIGFMIVYTGSDVKESSKKENEIIS